MNPTRAGYLACVVAWSVLHVTLAWLYRSDAADSRLFFLSVAGYVLVIGLAATPLVVPGRVMSSGWASAIAVLACAVELANVLSLRDGAITGYSNYAIGGLSVLMPALVFRAQVRLAVATAFGLVAIQWIVGAIHPGPAGFQVVPFLWLSVPPPLWLAASIVVQRAMRRGELLVAVFEQRTSEFVEDGDFEQERLRRTEEFESDVIPFLERVREADSVDVETRERARQLSASLRDRLVARSLLTPEVREAVTKARGRGVRVVLAGDQVDSPLQDRLRSTLPDLLAVQALRSVAVRVDSGGREALAVIETERPLTIPQFNDVRAWLGVQVSVDVEVDGSVVLLHLSTVRPPNE